MCFTLNHLLFGRKLLHSSDKTSTVVRNLTFLSSSTDKINRTSNHFLNRWRHGYVVNLRETKGTSNLNINSLKTNVDNIVLFLYEKVPRLFCRIARVTWVLPSRDSEIRGEIVKIAKTNTILKHPIKTSSHLKIHIITITKVIKQGNKSLDFEHYKY